MPKWIAKEQPGIEFDTHVDEEFDTENHQISSALGNEDGQNKLDNTLPGKKCKVVINYIKKNNKKFFKNYLDELKFYLDKSEDGYDNSINEEEPDFLIIEDFNTTGLIGNLDKPQNGESYKHFFLTFSKSKQGKKLGRRGQGRNVYWIASKIRAFFGYSIQHDTKQKLLRGISHAGTLRINDDPYNPYLSFTEQYDENKPDLQNKKETKPITNKEILDEFKELVGITRKDDEPGLSCVIPYPTNSVKIENLKNAYLRRFYAAILFDRMELEIKNNTFNSENIEKECVKLGISNDFLEFIYNGRTIDDKNLIELDFTEEHSPSHINEAILDKQKIDNLRKNYYENQMLSFKIHVTVPFKNSNYQKSYFKFHLKKLTDNSKAVDNKPLYMRDFLQLPEMNRRFKYKSKCQSFLWAEDEAISTFLGDSEGKAHMKWDPKHKDIGQKYDEKGASKIFSLINSCMNDAYKLITQTNDIIDTETFSEFLPKILSDETEEKKQTTIIEDFNLDDKKTKTKITKKKRKTTSLVKKMVEDHQIENGFSITRMETTKDEDFPMLVRSTCAYNLRKGDPFTAYNSKRHFVIGKENVQITKKNHVSNINIIDGNRIEFIAENKDFEIEITGFDTSKKDLYVKTRKLKDNQFIVDIKNG